jgi:energy-converting hydrogenase Eha subunit C
MTRENPPVNRRDEAEVLRIALLQGTSGLCWALAATRWLKVSTASSRVDLTVVSLSLPRLMFTK